MSEAPRGACADEEAAEPDDGSAEVGADLDALLAETTRERDEYLELARRARADFDNYRRRVSTETTEAEQRGRATLARNMLPALDNLERALVAAGVDPAERPDPAASRRARRSRPATRSPRASRWSTAS